MERESRDLRNKVENLEAQLNLEKTRADSYSEKLSQTAVSAARTSQLQLDQIESLKERLKASEALNSQRVLASDHSQLVKDLQLQLDAERNRANILNAKFEETLVTSNARLDSAFALCREMEQSMKKSEAEMGARLALERKQNEESIHMKFGTEMQQSKQRLSRLLEESELFCSEADSISADLWERAQAQISGLSETVRVLSGALATSEQKAARWSGMMAMVSPLVSQAEKLLKSARNRAELKAREDGVDFRMMQLQLSTLQTERNQVTSTLAAPSFSCELDFFPFPKKVVFLSTSTFLL